MKVVGAGAAALGLMAGALGIGAGVAGAAVHPHGVSRFPAYVGGHGKADAKLSPVTIGVVNQRTATNAPAPTWTTGVKVAIDYVNQHTGGIDGHPLKAVYCSIPTSVSSAATCGQQFANDSGVSAVAAGAIDVGNTALESALKPSGKPIFFGVSLSPVDVKDSDAVILYGSIAIPETPVATFAKTFLHLKKVAITYPAIPANAAMAKAMSAALEFDHIKVTSVGYTATDANLTEPFEAAHVKTATLLYAISSGGSACADTYHTLKSLGIPNKKVLVNVPCDAPTVASADGGQLPHDWYYAGSNPLPGSSTKGVVAISKAAAEYGKGALGGDPWVADGFGQIITMAKFETAIMKSHKKLTPKAVLGTARSYRGAVVNGAPHLDCGGVAGAPAECSQLVSFYENTSPNVMKVIAYYIGPPKNFKG